MEFKKTDLLLLLIVSLGILLFDMGLFKNLGYYLANDDWLEHMSYHRFFRQSVLNDGQFPLWCPYFGGGYPIFSYPSFPALNPLILITLLFGEVIALKLDILLAGLICAIGTYCLARYALKCSRIAAAFATGLVVFSNWLPLRVLEGNFTEFWFFLFPLLLYLFVRSREDYRYRIAAAVYFSFALMSASISYAVFVFFLVMLTTVNIIFDGRRLNAGKEIRNLFLIVGLSLVYGMVKILPMLELLSINSRASGPYPLGSFSFEGFGYILYSVYGRIGLLQALLCIAALIFIRRDTLKWLSIFIVCVFIAATYNSPVDLSALLSHLPVFRSIQQGGWEKYFDFFLLLLPALLCGRALTFFSERIKAKRLRYIFVGIMFIFGPVLLFSRNVGLQQEVFAEPLPRIEKAANLYHVKGVGMPRDELRTPLSLGYFNLLRGVGTIDFYTELPIGEYAACRYFVDTKNNVYENRAYRGEVYCLDKANSAQIDFIKPNTIGLKLNIKKPGKVVINQNYSRYWQCDGVRIENHQGLLALDVKDTGAYLLRLSYRPVSFYIGLFITCIAFLLTLVCSLKKRSYRRR
ncbi:MAG: hypothetical protein HQ558_00395 [Candidatus Omnitrophica bacterium]|nr:hypothetical protein [Candidatus Omnitrophota bacterium]